MPRCIVAGNAVYEICEKLNIPRLPLVSYWGKYSSNLVYIDGEWCIWDLGLNVKGGKSAGRKYFLISPEDKEYANYFKQIGFNNYDLGLLEIIKGYLYSPERLEEMLNPTKEIEEVNESEVDNTLKVAEGTNNLI